MNRFQKVMARILGLKAEGYPATQSFALTDHNAVARFGTPSYTGKSVTEQSAMQVSVAWACVRIITETIGSLPLSMYERDEGTGNAKKVEHDISPVLITSPNADMTGVEYREALTAGLALRGNHYSLKDTTSSGQLVSLYPLPADTRPVIKENGAKVYQFQDRGKTQELPSEKVWHVKGFGADGLVGLSPIAYARQALGVALAAEEFQARFFANGANPSWLISIPQWLDEKQRSIARENINKIWSGLDNVHRAQLLEGGMTAQAATMPLDDAQFMELRGFSLQEICRIYRIPPHMVADLSRSTNNNIEHQGAEFVMFTLAPYLTRIEASVARWLLKPEDRRKYFLRFNVDALLRADATGRANFYSSALQNGWMSRNEVRALENRNTVDEEGMDDYTVQSNLLPVEVLFDDERRPGTQAPPLRVAAGADAEDSPDTEDAKMGKEVTIKLPAELRKLFGIEGDEVQEVVADKLMSKLSLVQEEQQNITARLRKEMSQSITGVATNVAATAEATKANADAIKALAGALATMQEKQRRNEEIAFRILQLDNDGKPAVSH